MKIAFDAKRLFFNRRGLGNYSRDLIRILSTFAPENDYILCGPKTDLFPVHSFPSVSVCEPSKGWRLVPALWRSYGCLQSVKNVEIYHGLSGELPLGIDHTSIQSVVTVHDAIFLRYPQFYSPTYRWLFTQKVRYAVQHATRVVAISQQTKQDIIDFFGVEEANIEVIYQGCNPIFRQPISEDDRQRVQRKYHLPDNYVLTVGAIEPRKNLHQLIRAVAAAHLPVSVVAMGSRTSYADEAEQLAQYLGVDLQMHTEVPVTDLPACYAGAQVMVYPSHFEGFGIPILEAMCIGTPVVTTRGGCFQEVGGEAVLYADSHNPEEIGQQIQAILSDSALRKDLIDQGHIQSQKFTDEEIAKEWRKLYASLMPL